MSWKKILPLFVVSAFALVVKAAQPHVTTAVSYTGTWTIGGNFIYHIDPGGSVVINTSFVKFGVPIRRKVLLKIVSD